MGPRQFAKGKGGANQPVTTNATCTSASNSIADIFGTMRPTSAGVGAPSSAKTASREQQRSAKRAEKEKIKRTRQDRPKKDGLYHAAQASVTMDDSTFFAGVEQNNDHNLKKKSTRNEQQSVRRTTVSAESQGVGRIVTEDDIRKMTSRNKKAGTTPNCPFDCDCCY